MQDRSAAEWEITENSVLNKALETHMQIPTTSARNLSWLILKMDQQLTAMVILEIFFSENSFSGYYKILIWVKSTSPQIWNQEYLLH